MVQFGALYQRGATGISPNSLWLYLSEISYAVDEQNYAAYTSVAHGSGMQ